MADFLKFKKGLFADLDAATKVPGTIYVTTDEHAMYVDVSAESRIRIGDIIQVDSARTAQPPFSTAAIYYFIEENALMKWDGESWVQLNSTASVASAIAAIRTELGAATDAKKDNEGNVVPVYNRLNTLEAAITALQNVDSDLQDSVDALESQMWGTGSAGEPADGSVLKDIDNLQSAVSEHNARITAAQEAADAAQEAADTADAAADAAQSAAEAAQKTADGKADISHASADDTYGLGTDSLYGHVKLSDSTKSTSGVNDGVAATPAAVKAAADAAETAQETADTAKAAAEDNKTSIDEITKDGGVIDTKINALENSLTDLIGKQINAANAMNYISSVASYANLPTEGVHVGDTYVVSTYFTNNGVEYHAGDLLIATGEEDKSTGVITSDLGWSHVETGYIAEQENKLTAVDDEQTMKLMSYLNETLGAFKFATVADGEAGTVVSFSTDNKSGVTTISIDQQWGSF